MSRFFSVLVFLLSLSFAAFGQTQRDPESVALLTQALTTSGGANSVRGLQDFAADGTITYYWAGEAVEASATLKAKGLDQFRLDATLPKGVRSWFVSKGQGGIKEADGTITRIPAHNAIRMGTLTFPAARVAAALADASTAIAAPKLVTTEGRQFYEIRLHRSFDSRSRLDRFGSADIVLDAQSGQIVALQDTLGSSDDPDSEYDHAVYFSDYRTVSGISVPFSITERVTGQRVWSVQLNSVTFNNGLADSDFRF